MAISRYGMPRSGMTPFTPPGLTTAPGLSTAPGLARPGAPQPQAMPPAGLPPDAYATLKSPIKKTKTKPGPLGSIAQPRRITPSDTNQAKMMGDLTQTQMGKELTPNDVMSMDSDKWTKLLSEFGVFA